MIDHLSAIELITAALESTGTQFTALAHSLGRVLAEDVIATVDHPFFDQSAVDGYAFYFSDKEHTLEVVGEVAAGSYSEIPLKASQANRIFTGAPVTGGADTVVMQEFTERIEKEGKIFLQVLDEGLKEGGNIRRKGEQLRQGDVTLTSGTILTPSGIGFLASIGVDEVTVYNKVSVGIIVSGNEFADKGAALQPGKIYESNGIMLQTALNELGIDSEYDIGVDNQSSLEDLISQKLESNDLLIITGGVSVGDYDFTRPALENLGFKTVFHKVSQKPGKPILFVKRDDGKVVFGLPGNPRSAMVCYYIYVYPALLKMMGKNLTDLLTASFPLGHDHRIKLDGKTHFVAAALVNGEVIINRQQGSHMMMSMAQSNLIAVFPTDKREINKGDLVDCHLLFPYSI